MAEHGANVDVVNDMNDVNENIPLYAVSTHQAVRSWEALP